MRLVLCAALLAAALVACTNETPPPAPEPEQSAETKPADPPAEATVPPVETPPAGAKVVFVGLTDGAVVPSPIKVQMGVEGLVVEPAGLIKPGTGHHHLIVDGQGVPAGEAVPKDDTHIHFGQGQTEHTLELSPGKHTLTLQFADGLHRSYGPALSTTITVEVSASPPAPVPG